MMKKYLRILKPALFIGIGITLALAAASLASFTGSQPQAAAALYQAPAPTPTVQAVSQIGSTDGITLMGIMIVLIIILPILLRKQFWTK